MAAWRETAIPTPLVDNAGADRDRAAMDVAVIDVPAVLAFGISAAGESGHVLLKRGRSK
jgi:hypothetical protein